MGCCVWTVLHEQGRWIKWLAEQTGIPQRRLYGLKYGDVEWWLHDEAVAVARALDRPVQELFPAGCAVLPPGRKRPKSAVAA